MDDVDVRVVEEINDEDLAAVEEIHAPKIKSVGIVCIVLAIILVVFTLFVANRLVSTSTRSEQIHNRYNECVSAASALMIASDYLTTECRMFVVTGDRSFMDSYVEEILVTKRRDAAVDVLSAESGDEQAAAKLNAALGESNALATLELYAMKLTCEALGIEPVSSLLNTVEIKPEDEALSAADKRALAESMVLGDEYREMKALITNDVNACATELVRSLEQRVVSVEKTLDRQLGMLLIVALLFMALVAFSAIANYLLVARPMRIHERNLRDGQPLDIIGCYEIRRVSMAYNVLLRKNQERTMHYKHEAETDALTGVLNRGSYDKMLASMEDNFALILTDVDHFKEINDEYGHEVGDAVLKKVAHTIVDRFRGSDHVCRIGGDEFAIIMPRATPASRNAISEKFDSIAAAMADSSDGVPSVAVSFGAAFSNREVQEGNIYHDADTALYQAKHAGRNRIVFYDDMPQSKRRAEGD